MIIEILNRILLIIFVLSMLNTIWHIFFFIQAYAKAEQENTKYIVSRRSLLILGLSIAYIITSIITGIKL